MSEVSLLGPLVVHGACYALGCVLPGYYLVRWRVGVDLRAVGSGGAGGTNAARVMGPWALPAIGLLDGAKGAAAVWLAARAGLADAWLMAAASAVVLGTVAPAQLGWRGGKGVATSLGALAVALPAAAVALVVVGAPVALLGGRMAAGAAAYAVLPVVVLALTQSAATSIAAAVLSATVLFALRRKAVVPDVPSEAFDPA